MMVQSLLASITQMTDPATIAAGSSALERYGIVGFVALAAVSLLVVGIKNYARENAQARQRLEEERKALRAQLETQQTALLALSQQMVATVKTAHEETLKLLDQQRDDHETRFQALFDRHLSQTEKWAEKTHDLAAGVTKAFESLSRKLRDGG